MSLVNEFKDGQKVEAILLIQNVTKGKSTSQKDYLTIILQDQTGQIAGKKWEVSAEDLVNITAGKLCRVSGIVNEYRQQLQLKVNTIEIIENNEIDGIKIDPANFVASAPVPKEELIAQLGEYVKAIEKQRPNLGIIVRQLLKENFEDFSVFPAASKNHHAFASGLIYHVVSMLKLAKVLGELYDLDLAYLYAGIIVHDIGKVKELSGPIATEYTLKGKLLGHISITCGDIERIAREKGIDDLDVIILQHLVLSHHGKHEFGSPILPMTREAEILNYIDNIDAKMNMLDSAFNDVEVNEFTPRIFPLENRSFLKLK